jgi:hypothetical protein
MKSLEDIVIEKTSSHLQTGTDGIARKVTNTFKHKLKVKTINDGLRYVHLLVDYFILGTLVYLIGAIPIDNQSLAAILGLITFLFYPLFYTMMEFKFQQTPGKMLTNYVVINKFAANPDFSTCLLRTLIRFVPFEGFSCLGAPSRGWHDRWTHTYVVHKDEVPKLKLLLEKENGVAAFL